MEYFPHDTDASGDEKVEILRALYGNDGYAFYFILLERIYRTAAFELPVSDAETIQILARKVAVTEERFQEMLATALKWGCFSASAYADRKVLTSEGIKRRAAPVIEKRSKMREKYEGQTQKVSDAETLQNGGVSGHIVEQSKVEESRVEESTGEKNRKETEGTNPHPLVTGPVDNSSLVPCPLKNGTAPLLIKWAKEMGIENPGDEELPLLATGLEKYCLALRAANLCRSDEPHCSCATHLGRAVTHVAETMTNTQPKERVATLAAYLPTLAKRWKALEALAAGPAPSTSRKKEGAPHV
jgi:hypothetical protein